MKALRLALLLILWPALLFGANGKTVAIGHFSNMPPGTAIPGWQPLTFDKIPVHTRYSLVADGPEGTTVLKAESHASASGLVYPIKIDPATCPWLTWRWKISRIIAKGDVTQKSGDDYAARIYITFDAPAKTLSFFQRTQLAAIKLFYGKTPPTAALAYVWGNRAAVGSIHPNPFTDRVRMIVVESGPQHANQWRAIRRNLVNDFQAAFGYPPPPISSIAIMTDTDNTASSATAWYRDITLEGP
ncbi:conserved hypothetical protein [Desulfosarcina cetonica]|nr:conserved hypothetical protein [Desulfosarcina cetonica]